MPKPYNLTIERGDTYVQALPPILDSAGHPIPLTGTWMAQMRLQPDATAILASFVVDLALAAEGVAVLRLDAPTTSQLTIPGGVWDLQQTDLSGNVTTWYSGTVEVDEDVTH
jgi:hypothetical protein